jgi:cysteine desulfurase
MSAIASTSLRQASRLCLKQSAPVNCLLRSSGAARVAGISTQKASRRGYVSESKKDNAQVSVDTAIRADQKTFFAETGKLPESQILPGTSANADAMMSPIAGIFPYVRGRRICR